MIVVDASAVVEFLLDRPGLSRLSHRLLGDRSWHAPHLLDLEATQALRRWVRMERVSVEKGRIALDLLSRIPLTRWPHLLFLPRVWRWRERFSAYDASYIALAEVMGVALVTCDGRLAVASSHGVEVEVFP